jgi:methylase of polypeptide subunit release factors
MSGVAAPLLDPAALAQLRTALDDYTVDGVHEMLGPAGRTALDRGDLDGVARALPGAEKLSTLLRLFLLGEPVAAAAAATALAPLGLDRAGPLLARDADQVRARHEIRPYADGSGAGPWWVVSDFGSDVRPGPLAEDHVLGVGAASLTVAQAVPRRPVERALDLGTGCGVQALHLAECAAGAAEHVVATDVSDRALRLAATTAALSGQRWELRRGSLLDPVRGEGFDVVVANPPFVVSPGLRAGAGGFDYRDSGLAGDDVTEALLRGVPTVLAPGGSASLLANWIIPADGDWPARVSSWLDGSGCDAWVWQREVLDAGGYVSLWLRDAGELPGTMRWRSRYNAWLDWFAGQGVVAVGMGLVTLWRNDAGRSSTVCEDVPQAVEQPCGPHVAAWFARHRWLAARDDRALLGARLQCGEGVVRLRHEVHGPGGWRPALAQLRQPGGLRWDLDVDEAVAGVVGACDGTVPLGVLVDVLAASSGAGSDAVAAALLPVVRDLLARGFLEPAAG